MKALFVRHTIVEALQDISFSINEGEIVGYIGTQWRRKIYND